VFWVPRRPRIKQGGYCVIADADGDHAYFIYEANDNNTPGHEVKGTFDYTSGTGKYKGITGNNTYHVVGANWGRAIWNDAPPRKVPVLGLLVARTGGGGGPDYFGQHFFGSMHALGWNDNYVPIGYFGIPGDELADAARGLVAQKPAAIVAWGDSPTRTAQAATTSIPIVGLADDMTASGLVASLAKPGEYHWDKHPQSRTQCQAAGVSARDGSAGAPCRYPVRSGLRGNAAGGRGSRTSAGQKISMASSAARRRSMSLGWLSS